MDLSAKDEQVYFKCKMKIHAFDKILLVENGRWGG